MWTDEIVEEIHRIREEYAKSFNYDLDAIFADLRQKEAASGRKIVNLSHKPDLTTCWSEPVKNLGEDSKDTSRRLT